MGANLLFPPQYSSGEEASEAILHTLHQAPKEFGQSGTRWKLQTLLKACKWLCLKSLAGLWQLLKRLRIHWKRARAHVHSPDLHYVEKLSWVKVNFLNIDLETNVFLFQDEFTFYRQPSLAWAYEAAGKRQPLAELGWRSNLAWRIAATMNGYTGQVTYLQGFHIGIRQLLQLYQQVVLTYPQARLICIAQDNWPVHYHPTGQSKPVQKPNNSTCRFAYCLCQPMRPGPIQLKNFGVISDKKSCIYIALRMIGMRPNRQLHLF